MEKEAFLFRTRNTSSRPILDKLNTLFAKACDEHQLTLASNIREVAIKVQAHDLMEGIDVMLKGGVKHD